MSRYATVIYLNKNKRRKFKTYYSSHDSTKQLFFLKYTNLLNKVKLLLKKMFHSSEINSAANDSQQTWKTLQNLSAKKPSERTQVQKTC